jgi:hypothetical protein
MKCMRIGERRCNCSCFEIDQEMDAILLIIGIVYGVCRIVIKSVCLTINCSTIIRSKENYLMIRYIWEIFLCEEEFEDTKGAIRIRLSKKNKQHNGQKRKYKRIKGYITLCISMHLLTVNCVTAKNPTIVPLLYYHVCPE